jgi:hypothetical protein
MSENAAALKRANDRLEKLIERLEALVSEKTRGRPGERAQ